MINLCRQHHVLRGKSIICQFGLYSITNPFLLCGFPSKFTSEACALNLSEHPLNRTHLEPQAYTHRVRKGPYTYILMIIIKHALIIELVK